MELLLVDNINGKNNVVGTTDDENKLNFFKKVKCTKNTIDIVKEQLNIGNKIVIDKNIDFLDAEITPDNITVIQKSELERYKDLSINKICCLIHDNISNLCILDSMEYLDSYMKLLANGIYITDDNRDDKYFEIIESASETEEPEPLNENSSFSDEQEYFEKRKKFQIAQNNLSTLEKYLNSYDKLTKIKYVHDLLMTTKDRIQEAQSVEDIDQCMSLYKEELHKFTANK